MLSRRAEVLDRWRDQESQVRCMSPGRGRGEVHVVREEVGFQIGRYREWPRKMEVQMQVQTHERFFLRNLG